MKSVSVRIPDDELDRLDSIVTESKHFDQRSQAIRYAIRVLLQRDFDATATGYRVQSTPTKRERAETIQDYLETELGAKNVTWGVVPATEVEDDE